jgi:CRP/FNR family transcriptional regulator
MAITKLKSIPLLRDLPPADLRSVAAIAREREYPSGAMVFSRSEAPTTLYLVLSGRVKIFSYSTTRKRKTFAYLGPGDFFGELGIITGSGRSASAQAVADSRMLLISGRDFRALVLSKPRLCFNLLKAVSERLLRADEEIESLLFRNILGRVAKVLCDLSSARRKPRPGPVRVAQHYTHQELADLVGTTREPLSRALGTLRRAGIVEMRHGEILVCDSTRLRDLAQAAIGLS